MTAATTTGPVEAAADAIPQRSFRAVWLITAGHMMTHWYPATFYLLMPLIGNELGLSFSQIGAVLTCQYVAGALSNVPGGILVDSVGRKGLLMAVALTWVGIPYLIMSFAHSYAMLLICAALVGIGNNLWHPTAIPLLARTYPRQRGLVVSYHSMGANVGDALAPLVAGAMLVSMNWRSVIVINVIPGLIMSGIILLSLGRLYQAQPAEPAEARLKSGDVLAAIRKLLSSRTVVMLSLGSAVRTLTQVSLLTFLPVFLSDDMKYPPLWVGGCMFALQAAGFAAAPVAGHLSDRMGRRRIIMSSMMMTFVVLILMAFAGRSPVFVLFIAALGMFLYAVRAVLQAWLIDATPKNMSGTGIGILFGAQAVGAAIGPAVSGVIADHWGIMAVFYFLAATIVLANMFIFFTPTPAEETAPATV